MFRRSVVVRRGGAPLLRTAIVGGAAYAAGSSAAKHAAQEASRERPASSPAACPDPSTGTGPDKFEQLKQLGEWRQAGLLADAEFEIEKQKILRGY